MESSLPLIPPSESLMDEFEKSMEPNVSAFKSGGIDFDMKKYMAAFFMADKR